MYATCHNGFQHMQVLVAKQQEAAVKRALDVQPLQLAVQSPQPPSHQQQHSQQAVPQPQHCMAAASNAAGSRPGSQRLACLSLAVPLCSMQHR